MIYQWLFGLDDFFPEIIFDLYLIDGLNLHLFIWNSDFFLYTTPVLYFGRFEGFFESFSAHLDVWESETLALFFLFIFGHLESVKQFQVLFHIAE